MRANRVNDDWQSVLEETEWLLERWWFAISAAGFIYARPTGPSLGMKELAGFIERLRLVCDTDFPKAVAFDLCGVAIADAQWPRMKTLLRHFAHSIDGRLRIVSSRGLPVTVAIVYRAGLPGDTRLAVNDKSALSNR